MDLVDSQDMLTVVVDEDSLKTKDGILSNILI